MRIGHIDLSAHISGAEEQLVVLVEALAAHGVAQHVLVRNPFLAKRLSVCSGVSVGPIVRSPLTAYLMMQPVDLVHLHDKKAINAGVLLNLTRSLPYVLTHRQTSMPGKNPIQRSQYQRADSVVCPSTEIAQAMRKYVAETPVDTIGDARNPDDLIDAENGRNSAERMAAEHLRIYRRTLDGPGLPAMLI